MNSKKEKYILTDILDGIHIKRIIKLFLREKGNWFCNYLKDCHRSSLDYCYILLHEENSIYYLNSNINFIIKLKKIKKLLKYE